MLRKTVNTINGFSQNLCKAKAKIFPRFVNGINAVANQLLLTYILKRGRKIISWKYHCLTLHLRGQLLLSVKTYWRKCQPPQNFPAEKSDRAVQKLQIYFLNDLQTCRSSKFTFWTNCRRAEAPNLLFEPIADVQKLQIYFLSQLQACRSLKFTFWANCKRAEASNLLFEPFTGVRKQKNGEGYFAAFRSDCSSATISAGPHRPTPV